MDHLLRNQVSRRAIIAVAGLTFFRRAFGATAQAADAPTIVDRFDYLSNNGNSNCSAAFLKSIPTMPATARIQGSCCSPMARKRYGEQVDGLRKYRDIPEIPPDPYDIPAGIAQKSLAAYDIALNADEQRAYDSAMAHAEEKGPCCCQCWRWRVFGGLGKSLIRERGFTGAQVTEIWNLSNGCGGDA